MKKRYKLILLALLFMSQNILQAQQRDIRFDTNKAMYAANEEWLTFACEVPEGMVQLDLKHQSDMYWYSLYNLGSLVMRSGMGLHVVTSPLTVKHAKEDKGMPWSKGMIGLMKQRKFIFHKVAQFKAKSGAAHLDNMYAGYDPPKNAFPIYLEYASGIPTFSKDPELDDFGTLRWDKSSFDKSMNPAAWGQTMMKQVLWSRDFFKESRESKGVTYIGTGAFDGAHGFRGSMLLALAMNKTHALLTELAYDSKTGKLGAINPKTYDPAKGPIYYPHRYEVKFKTNMMMKMMGPMMGVKPPPVPKKFVVTDNSSNLFDVASLLWAASEFYHIADPKANIGFDVVFGDPMWIAKDKSEAEILTVLKNDKKTVLPADKAQMMSKGFTVVNFKNIMGLHFNKKKGTLVDSWSPDKKQSKHITTVNAGMAAIALANTYHRVNGLTKIKNGAKMLLTAQANFFLKQQGSDGSIANGYDVSGKADKSEKTLISQTSAMRTWLAAYQVTKDDKFLAAAEKINTYLEDNYWSESASVYRTTANASKSNYDGLVYGSTIGALRELAIARKQNNKAYTDITDHLDKVFDTVNNKYGLQLAELGSTGEMMPDKKQAEMMMAKVAELKQSNPKKAMKMMAKMKDTDSDTVPKPKFVKGTTKGAAPVTAGSVSIPTSK